MKHLSYYREQDLRKVLVAIAIVIALITTLYATATLERGSNDGNLDRAGAYDAAPDVSWGSGYDASPDVSWGSSYDAAPDVSWGSDYNATPDGGYAWNG